MKKLVAVFAVFVFLVGAVFAEVSVSGSVETRWNILNGEAGEKHDGTEATKIVGIKAALAAGSIQLSASDDEGKFGGLLKVTLDGSSKISSDDNSPLPDWVKWDRAYAWWKPIEQLEFFLGRDGDGKFDVAGTIGWSYHQFARDVSVEDSDASLYLLGNWNTLGAAVTFRPIDNLTINAAATLPRDDDDEVSIAGLEGVDAVEALADFLQVQASYAFPGIGTATLTWRDMGGFTGDTTEYNGMPGDSDFSVKEHVPGAIGVTFESGSLIEGLNFIVGGNVVLGDKDKIEAAKNPWRFGVGARYQIGSLGIKTRIFMRPYEDGSVKNPNEGWFFLKADLMPFYNFGFASLYCNFRLNTGYQRSPNDFVNHDQVSKDGKPSIGWHINPYIRKRIGNSDLRLGFLIGDEDGDGIANWKIPVAAVVAF